MSILNGFMAAAAAGYKPTNLPEEQIRQESGGKQKDASGKTLVGKYRDGSMPKPSERAYGVSQIQVATARETAKRHGIPWDEARLMNDRDYNLQLGDLHQGDLNQYYKGDLRKAKAAYHSGTGNVDRAIRQHGDNWVQGLGPHGREYVGAGGSSGGTGVATNPNLPNVTIPDVLRDQGRSEQGGGIVSEIQNPNQAAGTISDDVNRVQTRAREADSVLTSAIGQLQGLSQEAIRVQEARNERVDNVLNEQASQTTALLDHVKPLFAQKSVVAERRAELTRMNPLVKGFKSLFDATYDEDHLKSVEGGIDAQVTAAAGQYEMIMGAQQNLMRIVDASHQGQTALNVLEQNSSLQGIELAAKSLAFGDAILNRDMAGLEADQNVRAMRLRLSDEVASQMTPGQVTSALNQAKASSDGTVTVNGAKFTEGQLLTLGKKYGEQDLQLQQVALSTEVTRMNASQAAMRFRDESVDKLIGGMTTAQIRQAINEGGKFGGQQLPLDRLGAGLQSAMGRDQLMVQGTMNQGGVQLFETTAQSIGTATQVGAMRAFQMTGAKADGLQAIINAQAPEVNAMREKIRAAAANGTQDQVAAQFQPRLAEMAKQRQGVIDGIASQWAGNNKPLVPLAKAFLSGTPLNGEDSARGFIAMVRGGQRFGGKVSPEAAAAYQAAQEEVAAFDRENGGTSQAMAFLGGGKQNAKEKEAELVRRITNKVGQAYSQAQFNYVMDNAPAIAKQIGHLGQNLQPDVLQQAQAIGDQRGFQRVATDLGITPDEAKLMFSSGESSPIWAKAKENAQGRSYADWETAVSTLQMQATMQHLDATHPKIGRFAAGDVYSNLLANDRFADSAARISSAQGQMGFGDYVASSASGGSMAANVGQFGKAVRQSYHVMKGMQGQERVAQTNRYGSDPKLRFRTILGAIPDVTKAEEELLFKAITAQVPTNRWENNLSSGMYGSSTEATGAMGGENESEFFMLQRALTGTKLNDPQAEAIRRKVIPKFTEYTKITDETIDRFATYTPED